MAKKNENKLSYLQMPLPEGRKYYKMTKRSWSGLNYRQTVDTGALSMEKNISTLEAPYLVPSQSRKELVYNTSEKPICMFGFDNFLLEISHTDEDVLVNYIALNNYGKIKKIYQGKLKSGGVSDDDQCLRCVVQFNAYDTPTDPISGGYVKKLLIFPDKKSMFFHTDELLHDENNDTVYDFKIYDIDVLVKEYTNETSPYLPPDTASRNYYYKNTHNDKVYRWVDDESDSDNSGWQESVPPAMPDIEYAAVHLSRLFGVGGDRVYVSGYNDYANWNLDTVDEYNESNAWCSPAQSNTKAGGEFTGITNFQGHVVCFKRDFMHEIYNTKNPFRIQDIYAEGAIDQRTIQDVDGKLIFVSEDGVKIYTGSNPRIIDYNLNMTSYANAVSGTDGRCYYLYCEDAAWNRRLFVYDTYSDNWSEQSIDSTVLSFARTKSGMFMLCSDGYIYRMDTGEYNHSWSFETDLITNETVDIKHIKKIQMLADIASGANIEVYVLYDDEKFNEDSSHLVYSSTGSGKKPIRVKPRQTASYGIKLHVEGCGYVKLYELELFMEAGGDLYA